MYSKVLSGALKGVEGRLITVEADVSEGLPVFNMVGFLASDVREANERVRTAVRNSGFHILPKRITINLSPASLRKEGTVYDLAISIALLSAYGYIAPERLDDTLIIGELSLNGDIRPVNGVLPIVDFAKKNGIGNIILPYKNRREATIISGINVYGADNLYEVVAHLNGEKLIQREKQYKEEPTADYGALDFCDVKGQATMKRAVEIAVSGMHNLLILGPPGAGKSMIAKRIPTIMPSLTYEESVEITKIYSANGSLQSDGLIRRRPFRMPHHSVTAKALLGGGRVPAPGEISLAHNGVLFLDEFLEFDKNVIEMLRQPLEDGRITVSRIYGNYTFPCNFMLVAAMNPCPCGFYPDRNRCTCQQNQIDHYQRKMSQPILDRMDMCISVRKMEYEDLFSDTATESSGEIRKRVEEAHAIQVERYKDSPICFNSQMQDKSVDTVCKLGDGERKLRKDIFNAFNLSARGIQRVLKVSRTIADLDGSESVTEKHIWEAVSFRIPDFGFGGETP